MFEIEWDREKLTPRENQFLEALTGIVVMIYAQIALDRGLDPSTHPGSQDLLTQECVDFLRRYFPDVNIRRRE